MPWMVYEMSSFCSARLDCALNLASADSPRNLSQWSPMDDGELIMNQTK